MNPLRSEPTRWMAISLLVLMAVTRFHHESTPFALPDASLAIFFLGGYFLRNWAAFAGYLLAACAIDVIAVRYGGVSDYCISPAYGFLVPAYGVLWWAGCFVSTEEKLTLSRIPRIVLALSIALTAAFVISNGSFFLFSGRVGGTSWADYSAGIAAFYPGYLVSTLTYCGLILVVDSLIRLSRPGASWSLKLK